MEEKGQVMYTVYCHTAPNGKCYIGITKQAVKDRWKCGKGYPENNQPLMYRAIQKYGWDNFEHQILFDNLSREDALHKEKLLIALYRSNESDYGYNIDKGGIGAECKSEATLEKMSEARKQFYRDNPDRRKDLLVNRYDGTGKHQSKECIAKRSATLKAKNFHHTEEAKQKNRDSHKDKMKPVEQLDLEGNVLNVFDCIADACRYLGKPKTATRSISMVCRQIPKYKTAYGFMWRYKT